MAPPERFRFIAETAFRLAERHFVVRVRAVVNDNSEAA